YGTTVLPYFGTFDTTLTCTTDQLHQRATHHHAVRDRSNTAGPARQEGIEPPTHSLEGCCSIQLSYWRFMQMVPQVGAPGFEPGTSCSQSRRDTRLRYAPRAFECIRGPSENQLAP